MITRIVKLAIQPRSPEGQSFRELFGEIKSKIAGQPGCHGVELLESEKHFFTYSHWTEERFLLDYRQSELFGEVWPKTKALFYDRPEAWTCQTTDKS